MVFLYYLLLIEFNANNDFICISYIPKVNGILELAESKRQEIIMIKDLSGDHPESSYTSRLLNESIEQAISDYYISDDGW